MRIEHRVGIRLVHVTGRSGLVSTTTYYLVQTAWVDRPASGSRTGRLRCARCGRMIGFRVHSLAATRIRKRWLLGTMLGAAVALAGMVAFLAGHDFFNGNTVWYLVFLLVGALLMGTLMVGGLLGFAEDGVGWPSRKGSMVEHALKPLNWLQAWQRPADGDRPDHPEVVFD